MVARRVRTRGLEGRRVTHVERTAASRSVAGRAGLRGWSTVGTAAVGRGRTIGVGAHFDRPDLERRRRLEVNHRLATEDVAAATRIRANGFSQVVGQGWLLGQRRDVRVAQLYR